MDGHLKEGNSIEWCGGDSILKRGRSSGVEVKSCKWCGNNVHFFFWRSCCSETTYYPPPRIFGFGLYFSEIHAYVGIRKICRIAQHVTLGWYAWNNKQRSVQPHLVYTEEINALYRHMASLCPPIGCDRCHFVQSWDKYNYCPMRWKGCLDNWKMIRLKFHYLFTCTSKFFFRGFRTEIQLLFCEYLRINRVKERDDNILCWEKFILPYLHKILFSLWYLFKVSKWRISKTLIGTVQIR